MIIIFEINIHNTNTCPRWSLYVIDIVNDDNVIKDERKRSIYLYYLVVHLNQNLYQIEKNLEFVGWSRRLQGAATSVYDALQCTCAEDLSVTRVGVSPVVSTCRIESADSSTWRRGTCRRLFHLMIDDSHTGWSWWVQRAATPYRWCNLCSRAPSRSTCTSTCTCTCTYSWSCCMCS